MEFNELKKKQIVTRDGHFMPLIFTDIGVSTKVIAVGAVLAGREISKQIKDNKFTIPDISHNRFAFSPICAEKTDIDQLSLSISDIEY